MLYLIESGNYIKIGFSKDLDSLKNRMITYKTHNPDIKLLGLCEGTEEDECNYHIKLDNYKLYNRAEWFKKEGLPLVIPAFNKLGVDKVKKLRYVKSAIENAIINLDSNKSSDIKLAKMILDKISLGFISSKKAKEIIASAYKELKIDDSPKASNLIRWFDCKEITKKVDGKVVKGYEIYSPKFIFK